MALSLGMGALLGGGLSAIGGILGGNKAASATENASNLATAEQRRQFDLMREDYAPFRETGLQANNQLWELLQDPNYVQNISQQGINALDRSSAARGLYGSTGHNKQIADYVGNQAQGQYMNRLASLAGAGQTATANMGQLGQGYANNISQGIQNAGNARASSYLGQANSLSNGIDQFMRYRGMNSNPGNLSSLGSGGGGYTPVSQGFGNQQGWLNI